MFSYAVNLVFKDDTETLTTVWARNPDAAFRAACEEERVDPVSVDYYTADLD